MATFKATVLKDKMRADKTWTVFIRFTHEKKVRYIATTMQATRKDLTASFKIKNQQIVDKCDDLIREYRRRIASLNLELNVVPIDTVVDMLKRKGQEGGGIDFAAFARRWCDMHGELKGIRNYRSALAAFCRFFGRDSILAAEVTARTLKAFEESLADRPRARSLYTTAIARLFGEAREYYNDEDNDLIRIRHSLSRYKPPRQNVAQKRALTTEQVRAIFRLPYESDSASSRRDLALDCFRLSFCLLGMNSADLYEAMEYDGRTLSYCRAKTRDRRADHARMEVTVPDEVKPLFERYRGRSGHVFNFCERYSSPADFNRALNVGLKQIGRELGIERLQFYAARHSMATIAANEAGVDRWTVNLMLNHTDTALRVTELYIRRDFAPINEANRRVLDWVLYGRR